MKKTKIRVGVTKIFKNNHYRSCCYIDVEKDSEGWASTLIYLPIEYDLCFLKLKNNNVVFGWWTGSGWDGKKISKNDKVLFWKRTLE